MTLHKIIKSNNIVKIASTVKNILFFSLLVIEIYYSKAIVKSIITSIKICAFSIIPSLFPFFVFSDFFISEITFYNGFFSRLFSSIFKISPHGFKTYVLGNLCGFPVGAHQATYLYNSGFISKNECERLICFSSSPSCIFIISTVGALLGDLKYGLMLYIITFCSSTVCGIFLSINQEKSDCIVKKNEEKFNIATSIKNAGISAITVSSFIIFFSGIIGLLDSTIKSEITVSLISVFLEFGNATSRISASYSIPENIKLLLIAFSINFSGLSVYLQTINILPPEINKKKYIYSKLIQGIVASILTYIIFY